MADAGTRGPGRDDGKTPAQLYCYIFGAVLLLAGLLGFIADASFDTGTSGLQGDKLVVFEVNGWHNLVHIASGLFLLAVAAKRATAKMGAIAFGLVYGVVTAIGLIDGTDVVGLIPVNGPDHALHVLLSLLGLVLGTASTGTERTVGIEQRRAAA